MIMKFMNVQLVVETLRFYNCNYPIVIFMRLSIWDTRSRMKFFKKNIDFIPDFR